MIYFFLQFCFKGKLLVKDFYETLLSQKFIFILFVFCSFNSFSQCSADAGPDTTKCAEQNVSIGGLIAGTGNGTLTYSWSPAVGLSCADCPNPISSATVNTTYTLTVTDSVGCVSTDQVEVIIAADPNASFTFSPTGACSYFPVLFSPGSPAGIQTYQWSFGDPSSGGLNASSQQNPSHIFETFGSGSATYSVQLIATNAAGCKDTVIQNITVLQTPGAALIDPTNNFQNCTGSNFNMTVYDATVGSGSQYTIIWGDGTANYSSTTFPSGGLTHLYNTADIFDLSYIVNGTNGCSDTANYVVANITNPSIGIANPGGTIGCGPTTICFPLSSYSSNHISTIYVVNFGDGSSPVTFTHPPPLEVCHTYSTTSCGQPGNAFTLSIKASNFCDSSFSSVNPIKVYNGPTANFTVPTNRCVNTSVLFTNTTILGNNASCSKFTTFIWDFGDGSPLLTLNQLTLTNPSHTYTLPGTYTVTLTTSNPCATTTHTATICIEGPPTPNFTLVNPINCVPFSTAVNNSSTALNTCSVASTWSVLYNGSTCLPSAGTWNFSGGTTATSAQPEIQFVSPGTYTVRLTQVNSCGTFLFNQSATGQSVPKITLNTLAPICAGTSVTPIATVNNCYESVDSYNWTLTGGVPSSSTLANPGPVLYPTAGSYTVSLQATNGCGTTSVNTPLAVFSPPIANAGNDVQFCSGGNSSIGSASTAGVSYSWSPSIGLSSGTAANPTLTLTNLTSAPIIYSYVVTATTTPGCFTKDTVLVTVNPNPVLTVNSPTICFGQTASLLVDGAGVGGTYNWNSSPSPSCLNCPNPTASPASTTMYTVIGTNTYGCTTTITSTVTVNALPLTNAGLDNTICLGSSATLTASGASTYTWSPSTYLNTTTGNTVISTPLTTTQYIVTGTEANGCTKNDTVNVIVEQPAVVNANSDQAVCAGGTITLNGSIGGSATTSTWTALTGTFSNATSLTSTYTPSITSGTVTLTLTTNDPVGTCTAVNDQVVITVNPQPTISSNNATICVGQSATLDATGAGVGGTYNWTASPTLSCTACQSAIATPITTTSYTVSGTTAFGCVNNATATVTVNPLPVVNAGADVTLCDQPITYTFVGTPAGGTWSGSPNITSTGIFTPNGTETSNLQYVYTNPLTGCQNTDTTVVTVSPAVQPTATATYSICVNNAAVNLNTVLSSTPAGGTWSGTGVTNPTFTPSVAGVGTYTATYTIGAGTCLASVTSAITVNPQPTISSNNATICVGQSATLDATGAGVGGTYNWTASPTLSCTACQSAIATPITTTSYTVSGTTAFGCVNNATATVTVNPLPVVNAGADVTLCDQPITYTFVGTPAGGTWSGSPNITSTGIFTPNGTETSNLQYLYTNPLTGCQNTDTTVVTVSPAVQPTATATYSICVNNAAVNLNTVLSSTPAGGTWSGTGVTNPTFTPSVAGVGTYTVTYTIGAGTCLASVTSAITVNPQPTISSNNATICVGQSATLDATGAGVGGTYNWTASPTLSCTACQSAIATPITTTSYTVSGTTAFGCINNATATVTVNPLPVVNAGADVTLCDQPITYTFVGTPAGGTWSGSPNITSTGIFTPNGTETSNLQYLYTNPLTGCQNTDTTVVTVSPAVQPTATATYSICVNNAAVNLNTVLSSTPAGGTWSGTGVTNPTFTPSIAGVGTYTATYTIGAGTCLASVTSAITVNPQPTISSNNATICVGQSATLDATGAGVGGTYNWTASPTLSCTACQSAIATPITTTSYTVSGTTAFGCVNNATATVTVNPLPVVNAGADVTLCDQPITYTFVGTPAGGTWSGSPNITSTGIFTPNGTETSNLQYVYTNPSTGCQNTDTTVVTVSPAVQPTATATYSICVNNAAVNLNTVLSSTPAGGTWSGTGVTNPTFTSSIAGVGTYTATYTIGAGTCLASVTSAITVNPQPTISSNNATICVGQSAALNATGAGVGGTYNWTASPTLSCTACQSAIATPITTTSYTVSGTTAFGCVNNATATVTVNPLPVVNAGADVTLCDQPITYTFVGTPAGGTWSGSPNITSTGIFTPNGTETSNLQYVYTNPLTGCQNTDTTVVTVSPAVQPTATATYSICVNNAAVNLNTVLSSTPAGGTWSGTGVTNPTFTPSIAGVGTYTVTYTIGAGTCLASVTSAITVNPQPTISSNNATICVGQSATLDATGAGVGGTYNWTASPTLSCTACQSAIATPITTTSYTVSGTTAFGCVNNATATVTVNPLPVVNAGADVTLCDQPITYTFVGTPAGGTWSGSPNITSTGIFTPNGTETSNLQYLYTNPSTGCQNTDTTVVTVSPAVQPTATATYSICVNNAAVNLNTVLSSTPAGGTWSGTGVTNPTFTPSIAGVGTYTATYTIGAGTCLASVTSAITVNPQPTISSNNATICVGQSATLDATGAGVGGTYNWTASPTLSCTACQSAIATPITTTSYTVSGTTAFGCINNATATVTVNPLPVVNAGADVTLCDQPITYTFVGTPAGGTWSGSPNITSTGIFTPNGTETSNLQYVYTNPSTGCQNTDTTVVTVSPAVQPTATATYSICVNNAAVNLNTVLSSTPAGGTWSGTGVTNPTFTPSIAGVGTYTVTYTIGAGTCLASVTSAITVNPQPTISSNNATICVGQSATLDATGAGVGGTYNWTASPTLSCTACQSAIATPITTTSYTVSGTTSFGCSNTGTAQVTVNPLPVVNAGNDTTLCDQPIPVQMTGTIAGGTWSGPSISPTGLFTPSGTGTYSVTYTVVLPTTCSNSDVKIITVISPTLSNAGPDLATCIDSPPIVITGLPVGGSWSGPGVIPNGVFTPASSGIFGLIYTLGVGNCLTRDTMNFTVNALPIVNAGSDQSFCLSDNSLNFTGNPSGGTWSGTGITNSASGTFDPSIAGTGVHTIIYTYSDPLTSCLNRDTLLSTVHPLPSVSFNYNPIICQGVSETYTNTSTLVASSQWDFGDGVTSSSFSETHVYTSPGFYDVQLVITSPFGCVDSLTQTVEVRDVPTADFTIAVDSACGVLSTGFVNNSLGSGLTYLWNLGNGQTSGSSNPGTQLYGAATGIDTTYYVQLTVTNNCGASSYLDSIIVMPQPIALFGTNVNSGCSPLVLSIANLSSGLPDSYFWDFGNGSTSTSSANLIQETFVTGNASTTYTISLVVQNECGVDSTSNSITVFPNTVTAFFNSSVTTGCENLTVNFTQFSIGGTFYNWDFGDNNTSTQLNPTHTFMNPGTYDVTLFVNDGCAFDTMVTSIVVYPAPQVNFSVAPDSVCINEPFTFTNLSSNLSNSFWTFGDGGTSGLTNPQYAYSQPGNYSVTLVGTSITNGCIDSVIHIVQVSQNSISSFTANALSGCVPFNVQFTNSSSNSAYQSWNFGDGNSSTAISPGHIFTVPGTYEVQLITESTSGCSDTSVVSITVHPVPVSNFTFVSSNTCYTPVIVTMTNNSTGAINYSWDFGNGQTSSNTNTSVTYNNPGTYLISLVAENQYGCQSEYTQTITVYPTPVAQFQLPTSVACANDVLFFASESLFADSVNWIMGDGSILSGTPVNYAYTDPGNYFITLIAFGAGGCGDTLISNSSITINPDPVANFEYVNVQIPDPLNGTVEFTNLSQGATNYTWFFANDTTSNEINPIHQFYTYGTYNTTLVAINEFGCTDTLGMDVVVDFFNGLFLPNAIYPGSGIFGISHFIPKGVGLKEYELQIYDDWGNLIWQTTALDINGRPSEFWDGTFNGVPVQQDAYVWKVSAVFLDNAIWEGNDMKTNKIKKSGTVTVIR